MLDNYYEIESMLQHLLLVDGQYQRPAAEALMEFLGNVFFNKNREFIINFGSKLVLGILDGKYEEDYIAEMQIVEATRGDYIVVRVWDKYHPILFIDKENNVFWITMEEAHEILDELGLKKT